MDGTELLSLISGTKISVKGKDVDLASLFEVEEEDLSKEFIQQASLYAYFATASAEAEHRANMAEFALEQEQASADADFRAEMERQDRKYTEAVIKGLVIRDTTVAERIRSLNDKRFQHKLLKAICSALEMRAQMLQSLGSHLRHEYEQTGMNTRELQLKASVDNVKRLTEKRK